jgi:hypothetical protein
MTIRHLPFLLIGLAVIALAAFWFFGNKPVPDTEGFTYVNASADKIMVELPFPWAVVGKSFSIIGKARGPWYFEASFPYHVLDTDGNVLAEGPVQAGGDWMTSEFVPFKVDVTVPESYIGSATILLKNDNPSGKPENDQSVSFPITIEY